MIPRVINNIPKLVEIGKKKIENLEGVLLNLGENQKITDYKITRLTAPGDNYGSLMLRLEVKVYDKNTKREDDLDLVAKLLPPSDFLRNMFNVQVVFRNESSLYRVVVPVLEQFQRRQGVREVVDIFPKYYGSRISLNPNSEMLPVESRDKS
ncbi:hypothetical protein NQ317_012190 [Molorchus minor]|uniref:Uncharacterized protein n=1 Tax=Molorchus minor TaxID=1323400 RepID=A0ABQ9K2V0_9CUCU|nr:hypothetical protein NQ317_012190 [Molorchus minor]